MVNSTDHYPRPGETPADNRTCIICEYGNGQGGRGSLENIGFRKDNNRPLWVHERCRQFDTANHGISFSNLAMASKEEPDNIWAFASKFKYFIAASGTDQMPSTVQQTVPAVKTEKEQPAMRSDTTVEHSGDGTYKPPTTF